MSAIGKIFKNGRSQAVRVPARYRFPGTEVEFRPGPNPGEVILSPVEHPIAPTWDDFFRLRDALDLPDDFMRDRDQGVQERDDIIKDV